MTPDQKLRELLRTRPIQPTAAELSRWWDVGGQLLLDLANDLVALDCDLVAERAAHRRTLDERALLRVELDRERIQHTTDNEGAASALAQVEHEKSILEQVNAELKEGLGIESDITKRMTEGFRIEVDRLERTNVELTSDLICADRQRMSDAKALAERDVDVAKLRGKLSRIADLLRPIRSANTPAGAHVIKMVIDETFIEGVSVPTAHPAILKEPADG